MFEVLEKYLRSQGEFSEEEMKLICAASTERKIRKWQSILHDGEVWKINCLLSVVASGYTSLTPMEQTTRLSLVDSKLVRYYFLLFILLNFIFKKYCRCTSGCINKRR